MENEENKEQEPIETSHETIGTESEAASEVSAPEEGGSEGTDIGAEGADRVEFPEVDA